jgi:hypothetical protein
MNEPCPGCGQETLTLRKPVFDGFRKTGDIRVCASCGYEQPAPAEAAPGPAMKPALFDDVELPARPELFEAGESGRLCRHCRHYVIHPFRQWCGQHRREVEALDTCAQFEAPAG